MNSYLVKKSLFCLIVFLIIGGFRPKNVDSKEFEKCKIIRGLILKHYENLPKEKSTVESFQAIVITNKTLNKLSKIKIESDRIEIENFLKSKSVYAIYLLNKHCIRFEFEVKKSFFSPRKLHFYLFHELNNEDPISSPKDCKLNPTNVFPQFLREYLLIDKNWIFMELKNFRTKQDHGSCP